MNDCDPSTGLDVPYLLALDTPVVRDADGSYWADPSWARDLQAHIDVLPRLTMFGVVMSRVPDPGMVRLNQQGTRFVAARHSYGRASFYLGLPRLLASMVREIRRADVVHSTVAYGDAVPYGWFAFPIARLLGRFTVVTIEGSMWRLSGDEKVGVKRRFEAWASEIINRWCVRHIDYVAYQHEQYRETLPAPRAGGGVLFQASWVNDNDIISEQQLADRLHSRQDRPLRVIFATRLLKEKGTRILMDALPILQTMNVDVDVNIVGAGPDRDLLEQAAGMKIGSGVVQVVDPVPYGPLFFDMLADADLVLSPILGDEQPRIIYDAASQGVGAIVSDAPGMLSCVEAGVTAEVVKRGDAAGLASAIADAAHDRAKVRRMGYAARELAQKRTHSQMHRDRLSGIREKLGVVVTPGSAS